MFSFVWSYSDSLDKIDIVKVSCESFMRLKSLVRSGSYRSNSIGEGNLAPTFREPRSLSISTPAFWATGQIEALDF